MKNIIFLFLFASLVSQGQKDCPVGYSYMPSIGTSSLMISADTCLPDSVCKKLWIDFHKSMCGETGYGWVDKNYSYSSGNTWVNDSVGCIRKEVYRKKVNGKWIDISKDLFYLENKLNFK